MRVNCAKARCLSLLLLVLSGFLAASPQATPGTPGAPGAPTCAARKSRPSPGVSSAGSVSGKLLVAAAANIGSVKDSLLSAFAKKQPAIHVDMTLGASGALATQIRNGAPYDLFLSADTEFPEKLASEGFAAGKAVVYATGKLVLVSTKALPFKERKVGVLSDPAIKQFAIANPETAPYGKAAVQVLAAMGLYESLKPKIVTAQSVAQAFQFAIGATGAGFVNKSALYTDDGMAFAAEGANWMEVDQSLYQPISQAFIVVRKDGMPVSAPVAAFAVFLESPEARAVFLAKGYGLP